MVNRHDLLRVLEQHIGSGNGIGCQAIARALGIDERSVRKLVSEARREGAGIGSHPTRGYYMAESAEEIDHCCAFLRKRALHSLSLEATLRKTTLPDLIGQMKLKT